MAISDVKIDFTQSLPAESTLHLFSFLDGMTLLKCLQVNHLWQSLANIDLLWRHQWQNITGEKAVEKSKWQKKVVELLKIGRVEAKKQEFWIHPWISEILSYKNHLILPFRDFGFYFVNQNEIEIKSIDIENHPQTTLISENLLVAILPDFKIEVWDIDGKKINEMYFYNRGLLSVDDHYLYNQAGAFIEKRDLRTFNLVSMKKAPTFLGKLLHLILVKKNTMVFLDREIIYFYHKNKKPLFSLIGHTGRIIAAKIFNDLLFTSAYDKTIKIWDLHKKKCIMTLSHPDHVTSFTLIHNKIYAYSEGDLFVWEFS